MDYHKLVISIQKQAKTVKIPYPKEKAWFQNYNNLS